MHLCRQHTNVSQYCILIVYCCIHTY